MVSFFAAKMVAKAGAAVAFTGCVSTGVLYAGKKALAIEKDRSEAVKCETSNAAADVAASGGKLDVSIAPQFDGLNCFETIVSIGKPASSGNHARTTCDASAPKNCAVLTPAPQFDGLHCFETFVSKSSSS